LGALPKCVVGESLLDTPRPEHPRPDFERKDWLNLNGEWEFEIDTGSSGAEQGWASGRREFNERILVPFPPESRLSGLGYIDFMPSVWYRCIFSVPEAWAGRRLLLHFGAVDYDATVWVNGVKVGHHKGGYTPFHCDITQVAHVHETNTVTVYAKDDCRSGLQPAGKQSPRFHSYGCMYTRVTGIWQFIEGNRVEGGAIQDGNPLDTGGKNPPLPLAKTRKVVGGVGRTVGDGSILKARLIEICRNFDQQEWAGAV